MFRKLLSTFVFVWIMAVPVTAASIVVEYDIVVDAISREGEAENIGFFSTGSIGSLGKGFARISDDFPGDYATTLQASIFQAVFPGIASAGSVFFQSGCP